MKGLLCIVGLFIWGGGPGRNKKASRKSRSAFISFDMNDMQRFCQRLKDSAR